MNIDHIRTKKAMVEFALENGVKLDSSKTLKEMKSTFNNTLSLTELLKAEVAKMEIPIEGDASTVTVKYKNKPYRVIAYSSLTNFAIEHELRLNDILSVLDKHWINLCGYTFSTTGN